MFYPKKVCPYQEASLLKLNWRLHYKLVFRNQKWYFHR